MQKNYLRGLSKDILLFKWDSLKKVYIPAEIIKNKPMNACKLNKSSQIIQLIKIAQRIIIYSNGAIAEGDPILYAENKQKKPITPVNPILSVKIKVDILLIFQSISK